jgi:hypothetical protein
MFWDNVGQEARRMTWPNVQYLNREWNVDLTGMSHEVASGFSPNTAGWGVWLKPVDDASAEPVYGSIWLPDLAQLSEDDVRKSLESALLVRKLLKVVTNRTP